MNINKAPMGWNTWNTFGENINEDLIKETAPKLYDYTTQYGGDDMWTIAKQDGKLYGMPILENNGQYHYVSIWRDDWLRNVGINKIPETLEEAEDAFYKFVNNDPDGNGKKDTYALSANGLNAIYNAYGAHPAASYWALRDGKTVLSATLPEMKEALTKLNKWYNDGLIDPEFITGENKGQHFSSSVVFWNGRIGFSVPGLPYHVYPPFYDGKVAGSLNYKSFKEIQGENATFEYGVPLKGPEGKSGAESWGVFAGNFFVMGRDVGSGSEKMKKILEINEVLNTDYDFFLQTKFGREGTEYTNDNGLITSLLDTDQRRTLGLSTQGIQYMINNLEFIQNSETPESVEFSKKHGDIPGVEHYTKLVWGGLPSDSMYKSIIEQKVAENYSAFITGERDISEFELFVEELNNAGLAQLTAEAQEWYDARYTK